MTAIPPIFNRLDDTDTAIRVEGVSAGLTMVVIITLFVPIRPSIEEVTYTPNHKYN